MPKGIGALSAKCEEINRLQKKELGMFKSVFAKYITAFMAIIFVSFSMLAVITVTTVNNYSVDEKTEIMENKEYRKQVPVRRHGMDKQIVT